MTIAPDAPVPLSVRPLTGPRVAKPVVAVPGAKKSEVAVPGEWGRTGLSLTEQVIAPLVRGRQSVAMITAATFTSPLLRSGQAWVVRAANGLAARPLLNNPFTRGFSTFAGKTFPYINAGILAFDGYAAYRTFANPASSMARKVLVAARVTANAIGTVVCFIPGRGAVMSMPFSWAAMACDGVIKWRNAKDLD